MRSGFSPDTCYEPEHPWKTAWQTIYASVNNPYQRDYEPVASECAERWKSTFYDYLKTVPWTSVFSPVPTVIIPDPYPATNTYQISYEKSLDEAISSERQSALSELMTEAGYTPDPPVKTWPATCCGSYEYASFAGMPYTASSPCCGGCSFSIGDAQVYHWPDSTIPPSIPTLVNQAGYTL